MSALSDKSIRIVILDNQSLVRVGLSFILENQAGLKVVGQAGDLNEALNIIASSKPDIVLFDYDPKNGFYFDVFPEIIRAWEQARWILVTGSNDHQTILQAVQHGVMGVVYKTQLPDVLIKAIRKVHLGEVWIDHSLVTNIVTGSFQSQSVSISDGEDSGISSLSDREREVILCIGKGLKNKQIANQLCIGEVTVRHHLTSIYGKLGVTDRLQLLIYAQNHRLI